MSGPSALPRESPLPGALAPAPVVSGRRRLRSVLAVLVLVLLAGGGAAWWLARPPVVATAVRAYGSIDIRQSQLAFNDSDRIARTWCRRATG